MTGPIRELTASQGLRDSTLHGEGIGPTEIAKRLGIG